MGGNTLEIEMSYGKALITLGSLLTRSSVARHASVYCLGKESAAATKVRRRRVKCIYCPRTQTVSGRC